MKYLSWVPWSCWMEGWWPVRDNPKASLCSLSPGPHAACNPSQLRRLQQAIRRPLAAPARLTMKTAKAADPEKKNAIWREIRARSSMLNFPKHSENGDSDSKFLLGQDWGIGVKLYWLLPFITPDWLHIGDFCSYRHWSLGLYGKRWACLNSKDWMFFHWVIEIIFTNHQ